MKKAFCLLLVVLDMLLSSCVFLLPASVPSDWNTYQLPYGYSFQYPEDWKSAFTDHDLLYFYQTCDNGEKTIMAFQSNSFSDYDHKEEGITETNAYSKNFKSICLKHYQTGPIPGVHYGIDEVSADGNISNMRNLNFLSQETEDASTFKLFFTNDVTYSTLYIIMKSCEDEYIPEGNEI